jgi:polysaccharide deacetylase 2 family uncharacterized protein YibQ
LRTAQEQGSAIAIGHPHKSTIEFLAANLPEVSERFDIMSVSKLIEAINSSKKPFSWQNNLTQLHKDLLYQEASD